MCLLLRVPCYLPHPCQPCCCQPCLHAWKHCSVIVDLLRRPPARTAGTERPLYLQAFIIGGLEGRAAKEADAMTLAVLVMLQDVLLKLGRGSIKKNGAGPLHVVGMVRPSLVSAPRSQPDMAVQCVGSSAMCGSKENIRPSKEWCRLLPLCRDWGSELAGIQDVSYFFT